MLLTIYVLYSSDVILVQCEVVCVSPLVKRSHHSAGVIWVLQTQSMTKLMDRNQEQVYTWNKYLIHIIQSLPILLGMTVQKVVESFWSDYLPLLHKVAFKYCMYHAKNKLSEWKFSLFDLSTP